ncbi:MAG: A/G-specific adenine glycosylase [Phototrophicales bacterium]|nr:MAG: A/G-specific adenine glycosylase [Phototrophicales bacterium]
MSAEFASELLQWFDKTAAQLPWRTVRPDPYHVWLSEVMLQQTQVETVIPYYKRFLKSYPTIYELAHANLDEILKQWEGLGYYSRARHLHKTAQIIVQQLDGQFPQTAADLQKLPGIGRYTAGAIASIAFGEAAPVLDGNVIRVFTRLLDLADDITQTSTKKYLWQIAADWIPTQRPGDYNQALMELGQKVCTPHNPTCGSCPIQQYCQSYANGTQAERPIKRKKAPIPHYDVAAGIIKRDDGKILIAQRPHEKLLGGLWEFPGGKQETGETLPDTLRRELKEELMIDVAVGDLFVSVKHAFTHFKITLHAFECRIISGEPQTLEAAAIAWVYLDEMKQYAFGKADRQIIDALYKRHNMLF